VLPFSELVVAAEALNNQLIIKDIHGGIANLIYSFVLFCFFCFWLLGCSCGYFKGSATMIH
jgi:hypothetical protein